MTKVTLAAALVAVLAVDKISFNNELYEPGATVSGLTPAQAQGLVDNGHAKHIEDKPAPAAPVAPVAPEADEQAALAAANALTDAAATAAADAAASAAKLAPSVAAKATATKATAKK